MIAEVIAGGLLVALTVQQWVHAKLIESLSDEYTERLRVVEDDRRALTAAALQHQNPIGAARVAPVLRPERQEPVLPEGL